MDTTTERKVTGIVIFDGHTRRYFPNGPLFGLWAGLLLSLQSRGCPEKVFDNVPESEASEWRPDGWTEDDERQFATRSKDR